MKYPMSGSLCIGLCWPGYFKCDIYHLNHLSLLMEAVIRNKLYFDQMITAKLTTIDEHYVINSVR